MPFQKQNGFVYTFSHAPIRNAKIIMRVKRILALPRCLPAEPGYGGNDAPISARYPTGQTWATPN